jgi:hypothetical protein
MHSPASLQLLSSWESQQQWHHGTLETLTRGGGCSDYQPTYAIYPDLRKTQDQEIWGDLPRAQTAIVPSKGHHNFSCPASGPSLHGALALVPDRHPFCTSLRTLKRPLLLRLDLFSQPWRNPSVQTVCLVTCLIPLPYSGISRSAAVALKKQEHARSSVSPLLSRLGG